MEIKIYKKIQEIQDNLNTTDNTKLTNKIVYVEDLKKSYQCENKFNTLNLLINHKNKSHNSNSK